VDDGTTGIQPVRKPAALMPTGYLLEQASTKSEPTKRVHLERDIKMEMILLVLTIDRTEHCTS